MVPLTQDKRSQFHASSSGDSVPLFVHYLIFHIRNLFKLGNTHRHVMVDSIVENWQLAGKHDGREAVLRQCQGILLKNSIKVIFYANFVTLGEEYIPLVSLSYLAIYMEHMVAVG